MTNKIEENSEFLDPVSRTTEILFGLIMVLSFTCSFSAVNAGRGDVREMLLGALGCNLAWGIIDAFFYLLGVVAQRGRERSILDRVKNYTDVKEIAAEFRDLIPEFLVGSLTKASVIEMRDHLLKNNSAKKVRLVAWSDIKAAFMIFALVFLATFPVSIPFLVMQDPLLAIRVSNAIAIFLLFNLGYSLGRYAGSQPILWGLGLTFFGASLVSMTIALGG